MLRLSGCARAAAQRVHSASVFALSAAPLSPSRACSSSPGREKEVAATTATATRVAPTPATVNTPLRGPVHRRIPEGDTRERLVCDDCGFILYSNPLIVAGAIVRVGGDGILLARRNIAPRVGCWGLPVGFMECGESVPAGAAREVLEETDAVVRIGSLACLYSVPRASQVHMYFRADVDAAHVPSTTHFLGTPLAPGEVNGTCYGSGHETMETRVFRAHEIPWSQLAFPTFREALRHYLQHPHDDVLECKTIQEMPPRDPNAPLPL